MKRISSWCFLLNFGRKNRDGTALRGRRGCALPKLWIRRRGDALGSASLGQPRAQNLSAADGKVGLATGAGLRGEERLGPLEHVVPGDRAVVGDGGLDRGLALGLAVLVALEHLVQGVAVRELVQVGPGGERRQVGAGRRLAHVRAHGLHQGPALAVGDGVADRPGVALDAAHVLVDGGELRAGTAHVAVDEQRAHQGGGAQGAGDDGEGADVGDGGDDHAEAPVQALLGAIEVVLSDQIVQVLPARQGLQVVGGDEAGLVQPADHGLGDRVAAEDLAGQGLRQLGHLGLGGDPVLLQDRLHPIRGRHRSHVAVDRLDHLIGGQRRARRGQRRARVGAGLGAVAGAGQGGGAGLGLRARGALGGLLGGGAVGRGGRLVAVGGRDGHGLGRGGRGGLLGAGGGAVGLRGDVLLLGLAAAHILHRDGDAAAVPGLGLGLLRQLEGGADGQGAGDGRLASGQDGGRGTSLGLHCGTP